MELKIFTRYGKLGASSRIRFYDLEKYFNTSFNKVTYYPLINDELLSSIYTNKKYGFLPLLLAYLKRIINLLIIDNKAVLLIEKELLPNIPYFIEKLLLWNKIYILDYDDSIFHNYDLHNSVIVRRFLGDKIDKLILNSNMVFCGSHYILDRAISAGSLNCELVPTVVNIDRYHTNQITNDIPIIVWIGTPFTMKYVHILKNVFIKLSKEVEFVLRIIGGDFIYLDGVVVERFDWSENSEANLISTSDIGIMPLESTPWEKGKCGYKLIQYMSCSLPVVGSAVGENNFIIDDSCGYAVESEDEWFLRLKYLLENKDVRIELGKNGREKVEKFYTTKVVGLQLTELFNKMKI